VTGTFVQTLESQPWYGTVEQEMQAAGVPDYLWMSIVRSEDATLNVTQATPEADGTTSYGLFQFNQDPMATNVPYAGSKAANWLANALAPFGGSYTPRQALSASETAGWPGNDSALIAKEDPTRYANLVATMNELNGVSTAAPATYEPPYTGLLGALAGGTNTSTNPNTPSTAGGPLASLQAWGNNLSNNIFIGGVILAVIAGGFALVASSVKGPTVVPVPV
jgi:hypothetical protein